MGEPTVRRANEGFFTRLGRAIDVVRGEDGTSEPAKQTNAEAVKPLPKKYSATSGRVVRGTFGGGYVAKALKLATDMRALAVKEDHWYNRTKASDVDEVVNKYRPIIQAASASEKRGLAEEMLAELFDTPTGDNLFWEFESNPLYRCKVEERKTSRYWYCTYMDNDHNGPEHASDKYHEWCKQEVTTCTVAGYTKTGYTEDCDDDKFSECD